MARRRGTQKGYIHKQGKMWYIAYREDALDEDGRIVRVRRNARVCETKGVSKREAERLANETTLNAVNVQSQHPSSLLTIRQFYQGRFLPDVIEKKKWAGQRHYGYIFDKHVLPALGEKRLRDLTSDDVQALVDLKLASGLSTQTALHIRTAISVFFNHAKKKKAFHGELPTFGVALPEMERKERRALSFEMAGSLIAALPFMVRTIVLLSITTSMNIAEIFGLRWKRVNLTDKPTTVDGMNLPPYCLFITENYYKGRFGSVKKPARRRKRELSMAVVEALKNIRQRSRFVADDDVVFSSATGTPQNENNLARRVLKPIAKRLGIGWVSWHTFRHTHATLSDQLNIAFVDRQAAMGHDDLRMTIHYTQEAIERRREGVERLTERILTLNDTNVNESVACGESGNFVESGDCLRRARSSVG